MAICNMVLDGVCPARILTHGYVLVGLRYLDINLINLI